MNSDENARKPQPHWPRALPSLARWVLKLPQGRMGLRSRRERQPVTHPPRPLFPAWTGRRDVCTNPR